MNLPLPSKLLWVCLIVSSLLHAGLIILPDLLAKPAARSQKFGKPLSVALIRTQGIPGTDPTAINAQAMPQADSAAPPPVAPVPPVPAPTVAPQPPPLPTLPFGTAPGPPTAEEGSAVDPSAAPALPYFTTDQLTKHPKLISPPPRLETPDVLLSDVSGTVILTLWINESGAVTTVAIEKSDVEQSIAETAAAAFSKLRFAPGERGGYPVRTVMRIEVRYEDLVNP